MGVCLSTPSGAGWMVLNGIVGELGSLFYIACAVHLRNADAEHGDCFCT